MWKFQCLLSDKTLILIIARFVTKRMAPTLFPLPKEAPSSQPVAHSKTPPQPQHLRHLNQSFPARTIEGSEVANMVEVFS